MELAANSVHIWLTRTSLIQPSAYADYYRLLSKAELARNERFGHQSLRNTNILTRALLRTVLSEYEDCPPPQWEFDQHERGKPFIASPASRLFFNLSHSGEWVVCAVARFPVIGVDIEHCSRRVEVVRLARRFFSPREYRALLHCPAGAQKNRFFDYWTLKEAYIKARGEGIALGLDKFSFQLPGAGLPDNGTIAIECDAVLQDNPATWHFRLSSAEGDHRLALAVKPPGSIQALDVCHFLTVPLHHSEPYSGPLQLQEPPHDPASPKSTIQQ
jgi:4'-phosphopantetheinyl transferase